MISPNAADFDDSSEILPTKLSIVSLSFIFNRLTSAVKVCRRASLTRSAPICLIFIASHIAFAVSRFPTCSISVSGID